jgi:hypothetical protein
VGNELDLLIFLAETLLTSAGYVITNCGYCDVLNEYTHATVSTQLLYYNQLTAIAVKQTACDSTLLYAT